MSGLGSLIGGIAKVADLSGMKDTAIETAKWLAWKALIAAVFIGGLGILLNNAFIFIVDSYLTSASNELSGGTTFQVFKYVFEGYPAWIAARLRLVDCFNVYLMGLCFKTIRSFIPGI